MMLLAKILLVLKVAGATSGAGLGVYEACSDNNQCGTGLFCGQGVCTPEQECDAVSDCPAAPDGYSVVCEITNTCQGDYGTCRLGPGEFEECPEELDLVNGICVGPEA